MSEDGSFDAMKREQGRKKNEWYHFLKEHYLNSVIMLDYLVSPSFDP